jgi:hypothetical protein
MGTDGGFPYDGLPPLRQAAGDPGPMERERLEATERVPWGTLSFGRSLYRDFSPDALLCIESPAEKDSDDRTHPPT